MPTQQIVSVSDGARLTVSDLVGNPMWVPTKLKQLMQNQFISESLFRNGGSNPNGVVAYREGDPLFLDDDVEDVAEFGEIPVGIGRRGMPRVAFATKRGLAVRVSLEMIRENNIGQVNRQMMQLRNTFVRANDKAVKALLESVAIPTTAVAVPWTTAATSKPRTDIANGIETIASAAPAVAEGGSADENYGFMPDTIVLHPGLLPILQDNVNFMQVYQYNVPAAQAPNYTGSLPETVLGLSVVLSRAFPLNKVLILERGTVGFYSDTWPLEFTALYPEGNGPLGGPTQCWRSDAVHKRALAVDQPKAALWLTGVSA